MNKISLWTINGVLITKLFKYRNKSKLKIIINKTEPSIFDKLYDDSYSHFINRALINGCFCVIK
jgi:hypothetical protein